MKKLSLAKKSILGLGLTAVLSMPLVAAAPTYINYQGKLTNNQTGAPINNVETPVIFNFYDAETGGNLKHFSQMIVTPSNGVFSALIPVPADLFILNPEIYLAINVNESGDFSQRQRLVAAPYALAVAPGSVGPNELSQNMILPNTVVASSITADVMIDPTTQIKAGTLPSTVVASSLSPSVTINADQINAGTLPTTVVASSITAEVQIDPATQIKAGTLPDTVVASSLSAGVMMNAEQITPGGTLPALDGRNLTGLQATVIGPGTVGTLEIADGAVTNDKISGVDAAKLSGTIDSARLKLSNIYMTSEGRLILGNEYQSAMCGVKDPNTALFYDCSGNCSIETAPTTPATCVAGSVVGKLLQ